MVMFHSDSCGKLPGGHQSLQNMREIWKSAVSNNCWNPRCCMFIKRSSDNCEKTMANWWFQAKFTNMWTWPCGWFGEKMLEEALLMSHLEQPCSVARKPTIHLTDTFQPPIQDKSNISGDNPFPPTSTNAIDYRHQPISTHQLSNSPNPLRIALSSPRFLMPWPRLLVGEKNLTTKLATPPLISWYFMSPLD